MRIGVSCLQIDPAYMGGVNTYTLGLLDGFASLRANCDFCLYVTEANQSLFARFRGEQHFEIRVLPNRFLMGRKSLCRASLLSGSRTLYRNTSDLLFGGIRRLMESEVDIMYVPTVVLQFFNAGKPTVLSIHDIQHVHFPEFFTWTRRLSRQITYGLSVKYTTYLQASSEFIKQDLLQHYRNLRSEQVEVIPEGVNLAEFGWSRDDASLQERYRLPPRYLLYPAQLWPHKNHLLLLAALKKIEIGLRLKIPVVLTGARFSAATDVFNFIAKAQMDYVHYLGTIPFDDLVSLYQKADLVIAAGLYESNCLPVLEASAAGTPVIASRIPPNEELSSTLQLNLFDPKDADDLSRTILKLWNEPKLRSAHSAHNRKHVAEYSWTNAAQKYLDWFDRIASAGNGYKEVGGLTASHTLRAYGASRR
jgi:glycosyltransferase involved in cell wall biosynthesis